SATIHTSWNCARLTAEPRQRIDAKRQRRSLETTVFPYGQDERCGDSPAECPGGRCAGYRAPKIALPTRTQVAPQAMAISKSADMPIEAVVNPWRAAHSASQMKCDRGSSSWGGTHISPI